MNRTNQLRLAVLAIVVLSGVVIATDAAPEVGVTTGQRDALTVVSTHQFDHYPSRLLGFRQGELVYSDPGYYDQYFDVDPVANRSTTVEFVGVHGYHCNDGRRCVDVEFVWRNLTTRSDTVVWSDTFYPEQIPTLYGNKHYRYHDIDRINRTHIVVAGIQHDRVFMVDTRTGERTWTWAANSSYSHDSGGPYPADWTHLNDVEYLHDGRIMASLRNQDQVVFLRPGHGINQSWTLGCEDCYETLYEQHNPDYIPRERGGPAILVADSENNRVVEYHRTNGTWTPAWSWSDEQTRWPRDADRLPNGNTLIVDSNGNRVVEVEPNGEIVWQARVPTPYDVERLGTGDESAGGQTLESNGPTTGHESGLSKYRNALLFVLPLGLSIVEAAVMVANGLLVVAWVIVEWKTR